MTHPKRCLVGLLALLLAILMPGSSHGVAVMSVDLGSEWMKVAIVSPGVPMEIALNAESKRKTPLVISFRDSERSFGEDAQVVGTRFPKSSFSYILDLVGKPLDHKLVQLYLRRFPYYQLESDEKRNTVRFRIDEDTTYSPEELLAQLLHKAREFAETSASQKIAAAVITVPGFFNQAERLAVLQAAKMAEIKVLQLFNDYSSVALNYGIFNRKIINDTAHYVLFYDMGASSTTATIVAYQNVKTKERGFLETHPQVAVLGVGYDRTLGGLEMQIRLRDYLAVEFDKLKKAKTKVGESERAMAKLFKEAGRVKNVLSANAEHYAQIEGLLEEQDFRLLVTREKFEELCEDLFERVAGPVNSALATSGLTMDVISQVVLVGAGTRVPKVQEKLADVVKTELSKNINTDEAAALGAVYKAADLSQGFKVKKFITKDAVLFPIQIVFDRTLEDGKIKQVRKTLFVRMNSYPQKKIITFNKHSQDFSFEVKYAELDHLSAAEIASIGNLNISKISLSGVAEALSKHAAENAESKGIKAHFAMDESGILELANVELVSEKLATATRDTVATAAAAEEEGAFSKLGSTIGKLFSGSDAKEKLDKPPPPTADDVKPVHEEPEYPEAKKEAAADKNETKADGADSKAENKTEKSEKAEKEKKPIILTLKEPIDAKEEKLGSLVLAGDEYLASKEKLRALNEHDKQKARRENAFNNLESFVIDAQQKLDSDEYQQAVLPDEADGIKKACAEVAEWLYEGGFDAPADTYEQKLEELKKLTRDLYERVYERRERPEAIKGMLAMLNGSRTFLYNMRNVNVSAEIFTEVEMDTLERAINDTQAYHDTVAQYFASSKPHESPLYRVRDIANKMALLDREVKYLVNKAKIWRPKEPPVVEKNTNETETETAGSGGEGENDKEEEEAAVEAETEDKPESMADVDAATLTEGDEKSTVENLEDGKTKDEHVEL